jgi:hypothetical protein
MTLPLEQLGQETLQASEILSGFQAADGSLLSKVATIQQGHNAVENVTQSYRILCTSMGSSALRSLDLFEEDMESWRTAGLDTPPDFAATHQKWSLASDPDEFVPFFGPIRVPNSPQSNYFLFNFVIMRQHQFTYDGSDSVISHTTQAILEPREVHVVDAPVRGRSYTSGDGSVLFSELLGTRNRAGPQTFGAFIITDFTDRYSSTTAASSREYTSELTKLINGHHGLSLEDERAIWLQVHDKYHDTGNLPHGANLKVKMKFAPAVLDELKADCSAFLALSDMGSPWADIGTRHLLDKMLRFPYSEYGYSSVDGAVGELLLRKSMAYGALVETSLGLHINRERLTEVVDQTVRSVLAIEETENLEHYLASSNQYMQTYGVTFPPNRKQLTWLAN